MTNVDSQGSDQNIVIQVIGEISNNSAPHRKFVQTFVLAGQTNGYFVLNDIFRYIADEEEMEDENLQPEQVRPQDRKGFKEPPPTAAGEAKQATLTSSDDPDAVEQDASKVDEQLANVIKDGNKQQEQNVIPTNVPEAAKNQNNTVPEEGNQTNRSNDKSADADQPSEANQPRETQTAESAKDVDVDKVNASETKAPVEATPNSTDPPKPAAPKTWATLAAAANRAVTPAVPVPAGTPAPQPQPRAASNTNPPPVSNTTSNGGADASDAAPASKVPNASSGWHTAGAENNKRQARPIPQHQTSFQQGNNENPMTRAYIKNVYESVDADELKSTLSKYGELAYFDVNRMKVSNTPFRISRDLNELRNRS